MTVEELLGMARSLWTVWMTLIFAAIALWAFWPGNRARFDAAAQIPLRSDSDPEAPRHDQHS
ncbi:MAG: cbb3-type cytochrome c oxidase subunit 3 [Rhodospirillales bacterium]